jgi:hypothetical protein
VSLPSFSTQAELFSTAGLTSNLFAPIDRYRLFAQVVYPAVAGMRGELEKCYQLVRCVAELSAWLGVGCAE